MGKWNKERLKNPVLPPTQVEGGIKLDPCLVCQKAINEGYYGRYKLGGVCSKTCSILYMKERENESDSERYGRDSLDTSSC